MEIWDRLQEISEDLGGNNSRFEKSLGVASGYVAKLKKQRSQPSIKVVAKAYEAYPQYNLEWIISGNGEKLASAKRTQMSEPSVEYGHGGSIDSIIDKKIDGKLNKLAEAMKEIIMAQLDDEIAVAKKAVQKLGKE